MSCPSEAAASPLDAAAPGLPLLAAAALKSPRALPPQHASPAGPPPLSAAPPTKPAHHPQHAPPPPTPNGPATPPYSEHSSSTEDNDDEPLGGSAAAVHTHRALSPALPPLPPSPERAFFNPPKSFHAARASRDAPRAAVLKALSSRSPDTMTLASTPTLSPLSAAPFLLRPDHERPKTASSALHATSPVPALQSPCFYHQRFEKAINVPRLLEEISSEGVDGDGIYTSHSRLVQTALGVREVARQLQKRTCKMAVSSVMIVTKARDNTLVTLTREVAGWLMSTPRYGRKSGVTVYVDKKLRDSRRFDSAGLIQEAVGATGVPEEEAKGLLKYWTPELCWARPEEFDLVLTLGGDGTVLFTSWLFQRVVPPIMSFSLGSLGFLTGFRFEDYRDTLERVLERGMRVNMRMRFTCTVHRADADPSDEKEQFEVLNELVIDRGPSPYVSNLELYGDDELLTVVAADGCIFSTPTGSTAYSLSAGGSLVHPDIPAILLTPICAHTLNFRPMLLTDSMLLRVCIPATSRATAWCSFDGKGRIELRRGDAVTIAASQYPFPTVLSGNNEWIDSISRTLRWNTRGAQQGWREDEKKDEEEEGWDIDTDSGVYNSDSEEGSDTVSPVSRKMALLGM